MDGSAFMNWNGKPLLCSGGKWYNFYRTECWTYENNQWNVLANLTKGRRFATLTELSSESFIYIGGLNSSFISSF